MPTSRPRNNLPCAAFDGLPNTLSPGSTAPTVRESLELPDWALAAIVYPAFKKQYLLPKCRSSCALITFLPFARPQPKLPVAMNQIPGLWFPLHTLFHAGFSACEILYILYFAGTGSAPLKIRRFFREARFRLYLLTT